jgi:hypothetical protein
LVKRVNLLGGCAVRGEQRAEAESVVDGRDPVVQRQFGGDARQGVERAASRGEVVVVPPAAIEQIAVRAHQLAEGVSVDPAERLRGASLEPSRGWRCREACVSLEEIGVRRTGDLGDERVEQVALALVEDSDLVGLGAIADESWNEAVHDPAGLRSEPPPLISSKKISLVGSGGVRPIVPRAPK